MPSLCLMPLEQSVYVLFSPKLVVPAPTVHHYIIPIDRGSLEAAGLSPVSDNSPNRLDSTRSTVFNFAFTPKTARTVPDSLVKTPDLTDKRMFLYGACVTEWCPGPEAYLPRTINLISTSPRLGSLRPPLGAVCEALLEEEERGQGCKSPSTANGVLHAPLFTDPATGKPFELPTWQPERRPVFTPYAARSIPTIDAAVGPLFQSLSPDTLRTLITAVILEKPVVLRSHSRSLMVVCAEAIRHLLFPFRLMVPYYPLVPIAELCTFWEDIKTQATTPSW